MTEQRLGILGGMGRPPPRAPGGGPRGRISAGQINLPRIKVFGGGQNPWGAALAASGPMPQHDRRDGYV